LSLTNNGFTGMLSEREMNSDHQPLSGRNVLVVDDEADIRFLLRTTLELAGYIVVEAAHGEAALEQVSRLQPDAVVTDRMMPRCGGDELIRRLRAEEKTASIPVVMVTGTRGAHSGADAVLTKPFDPRDLVRLLGELIGKGR